MKKFALKKLAFAVCATAPVCVFAAPADTSAYATDPQYSYVEDATSKGIGQVNMITCFMSAMRPDALVNQGNYIALVDQTKCDPESRSSASNSGGDSTQASNYLTATVNSTRASNTDPMIARIWLNDEVDDGNKAVIFVRTAATTAPSASNAYGIFRMDFCGRPEDPQNPGQLLPGCMLQGYMQGSADGLSYFETEGDGQHGKTVALQLNAVGDSGSGKLHMIDNDNGSQNIADFAFAYNHDYFLRGSECFSRDANDADFSVWRYGLYDAVSGERVTRNSGFPIEYVSSSQTYHGYLGYFGLSLPQEAMTAMAADSNPVVQKVDYSQGHDPIKTTYAVVQAAGKLTKYTKHSRKLNAFDKIKFQVFVGDVTGFFNGATPFTQYEMYWDDSNGVFKATAQMACGNNGCESQDLDSEKTVNAAFFINQGGVQGFSPAMGGELFIDLHGVSGAVQSGSIDVVYRSQDIVYPSDMPSQLFCLSNCPTSSSIAGYFAPGSSDQSPFTLFNNWNVTPSGNIVAYSTGNALLRDAGNNVVTFTDASTLQLFPQYQSGIRSGRLFVSSDLANVQCDNQAPGNYCDYKVNALDTYYVWETGPNNWNQFAAVKDTNGDYLHFDAPLQVNYTVPNDASKYGQYAGKAIVLQYGGFGDLWGIPGQCVSHSTNQVVSCGNDPDARFVPAFIIRTGEQVTSGQNTYLVKWLEREIRFARKDTNLQPTACAGLTLPSNNITLPTAAVLKNPSDSGSDIYIGAKPTVTDAPRVIQGEVKY
jgi:hypothetical protein